MLIQEPAQVPDALYRRFARRAQVEALLPDHVVDGEPYLALNAMLLEPADHVLLKRLTETFVTAFDRVGRWLAQDVGAMVEMGFPWVAAELLAAEMLRTPLVGRFDFVKDERGHWWLLEYNADTPSGVRESIVVDELVHSLLRADGLDRPSRAMREALISAFVAAMEGVSGPSVLGLLTTASMLEDLAQMAFTRELLLKPLANAGVDLVLGDSTNLRATRGGPRLCGQAVGALYRYVPFEGMFGTPAFAAIQDGVVAGRLRLLNGLYGLLLQHKGLMARLWEHRDDPLFTLSEREAIRSHLPPTWLIDSYPFDEDLASLVAKQVFGREGEEVFFGEDLSMDVWQTLARRRTYVAQRRVQVSTHEAAVPTALGVERRLGHASVGCFAIGGRWAGYYTRFGGKVITSRAKYLATFVDRG